MLNVKFGDIINLSKSSLYSSLPQVAVPKDNHVYVIWHESSGIYGPQRRLSDTEPAKQKKSASILYRVSHDNGSTFGETKELTEYSPDNFEEHPIVNIVELDIDTSVEKYVEQVRSDYEEIAIMAKNGLVDKRPYFDAYWGSMLRC